MDARDYYIREQDLGMTNTLNSAFIVAIVSTFVSPSTGSATII
jgi:hypothetical protein